MLGFFKKILIPSGTTELTALQTWTVRWQSTFGSGMYAQSKEQCEVFITEKEALLFKKALEDAFKLTRRTFNTHITFEENV